MYLDSFRTRVGFVGLNLTVLSDGAEEVFEVDSDEVEGTLNVADGEASAILS